MTNRCEPPDGTPAGTVCVLSCEGLTPYEMDRVHFTGIWNGMMWETKGAWPVSVRWATLCGWRFVRVAGEGDG